MKVGDIIELDGQKYIVTYVDPANEKNYSYGKYEEKEVKEEKPVKRTGRKGK